MQHVIHNQHRAAVLELPKLFCAHLIPLTCSWTPSWEKPRANLAGPGLPCPSSFSCLVLSQKEDRAWGVSGRWQPTLWQVPCDLVMMQLQDSSVLLSNSALFQAGFLALKRLLLRSLHIHKTATILQLNDFIWHKMQYDFGNSKLQRQRKGKTKQKQKPWLYLIYS